MVWGLAVLIGTMSVGDLPSSSTGRVEEFEGWFRSAVAGELPIPEAIARKGRSFRYVFVEGYRNEQMPGYFSQNKAELRALGVPRRRIHVIDPSSGRSSEVNAEGVKARFLEIAGAGPEKLVIIAHSRGACDALAFALANAPFVEERVEALFLIQGPFGGSGAAEYVIGEGLPMDRRMSLHHRILGNLVGRLARYVARKTGLAALEGMTREASRAFWSDMLEKHGDAVATVGPRTFYVRSTIHPSKLRFARRAIAWYVQIYHGPGDGMVALADQSLATLGTVIATVEAGHADLTHRFPASRAPRRLRRAMARTILMAVGQPSSGEMARVLEVAPVASPRGR